MTSSIILALPNFLILRWPRSGPRRMRPRRPGLHPSRLAALAPQDGVARQASPFSRRGFAPELCGTARKRASKHIRGGGAPKGAYLETAPRNRSVAAGRGRGARRFWRTRSPSGALPRFSPSFLGLAQSGLALHGSDDVRYPGSQLLADPRWRAGRVSEPPRMRLRVSPWAPLPLHQSAVTG